MMKKTECPCGSAQLFSDCCEPLIAGKKVAPTAEALMRSRYSAFVTKNIDYIFTSNLPSTRDTIDRAGVVDWAENSEWVGLEILSAHGGPDDIEGEVEFKCRYKVDGAEKVHHERSEFKRVNGEWFFVDGHTPGQTIRRDPKVGRNEPCPCGSNKKAKKCCYA